MRTHSIPSALFAFSFALVGACSPAPPADGATDPSALSGGKSDSSAADGCDAGCGPGKGCLRFCDGRGHCTASCEYFGVECTQECGTSRAPGVYLFCPSGANQCDPFPDPDETGCSSWVYAQNDTQNCGMCDTNCVSCNNMECSCDASGATANLYVDPLNCGGCGKVCPSGVCAEAKCVP